MNRSLRIVVLAGLMLASLALPLMAFEVFLRAQPHPGPYRAPPAPKDLPTLGWVDLARANVAGLYKGAFYRTNGFGFRGPEVSLGPAPGTTRVMVIGDSVAMGSGVPEEDAYPALVEGALGEQAQEPVEVLNLAIAGAHFGAIVQRLERLGVGLDPDLVIYGLTLNDIEGPGYEGTVGTGVGASRVDNSLRFHRSELQVLRWAWPRLLSLLDRAWLRPGSYLYDLDQNYAVGSEAWKNFEQNLRRLRELGADNGFCVHVFMNAHPHYEGWGSPSPKIREQIADAVRAAGLSFTDATPAFADVDPRSVALNAWDQHPNPRGHRLLADALIEGLRQDLPPTCVPAALRPAAS